MLLRLRSRDAHAREVPLIARDRDSETKDLAVVIMPAARTYARRGIPFRVFPPRKVQANGNYSLACYAREITGSWDFCAASRGVE